MTLLELLDATAGYFEKHGVPQPRLNAELLIADGLGMKRLDLYLQFDRPVSDAEREKLRPLVRRRGGREPLQHVLGWTEFAGVRIACDPRALVPRPETELLVAEALRRAAAPQGRALDIGTGSGAVILAFLAQRPGWTALATDVSPDALALAHANADTLGLANRIAFHQADLWPPGPPAPFDLIVSNPPYIPSPDIPHLPAEVRADPLPALDGGTDGLALIRRIAAGAPGRLAPGAFLLLEIGDDQGPDVRDLLAAAGLCDPAIAKDLNGRDRIASARLG